MIGEGWGMGDVEVLYENPYIYDGWCAALLKDGRLVNRWAESDRRYEATEDYIVDIKEASFNE